MDQMASSDLPEELAIDLPEELKVEILSRLPVKPLMRFRCVCKSWYALVETPSFISKHLLNHHKNNNNNNNRRIDDDDDDDDDGSSIIVKRRRDNNDSFLLLSYETLDVVCPDLGFQSSREDGRRTDHEFMGCCNGVVCIYDDYTFDMILWNPATRQMRSVPESPIPHPKDSVVVGVLEFGFGYDVKTNDYKVIRLVTFVFPHQDRRVERRTEVYTLSTDSWRIIDAVVPGTFITSRHHRACVNEMYSTWGTISDDIEAVKDVLISFDMSNEVFLLTPLPEFIVVDEDGNETGNRAFTVLNESFAVMQDISGKWNTFEVWLLNEYGPNGCFTKVYTVGPFSGFRDLFPLGIWKKNELFFQTRDGELVLGDPNAPTHLKSLKVVGDYGSSVEILAYKESLVSIKGGNNNNHLP